MALSFRNSLVLCKLEVTEGVDPVPTEAADAILANVANPVPQPNIIESEEFRGSLDAGVPIIGGTPMQIDIQVYSKGSGAAGTPPEVDPLLQICGFDPTIVAVTSVTYDLISTAIKSGTIYIFRDGLRWKFTGCRGDATFTAVTQQQGVWDFTLQGRFAGKDDTAALAATFDATIPPVWINGGFTIAAAAAALQQLSISLGNTLALPDNPNDVEGFDAPVITRRDVQGQMNPLETLVATRDIFADFRAGTPRALQAVMGTVAGNILTVDVPAAVYRGETQVDRDGLVAVDVPFSATGVDSGVSFAFT